MKNLTIQQTQHISGGEGHFKAVVTDKTVPATCASQVASIFEKHLTGQYNDNQAVNALANVSCTPTQLDKAIDSIDIIFYP